MAEVLKKFGRYFLLDQIAQGGMAEIYRARLAAKDGAGRLLVIKRIQAGYGQNNEFLQMFRSEIKVTMGFSHPNIVQLYDFGDENNQPYIAMEMVDGKNLRQFISRFAELRQPFPIELAAHIAEQAACGLHYAHSFRDKISGEPLSIVHRDISPQNILISFEGTVKVIDFGIAKATTNVESTRAGVIKGKPSYLSPEQISGDQLDGRSDLFSLGTVLWETLTGKKLFSGESDLAVLKLIESCQSHVKPPSTLNPRVPKELDYIVLRSLAKQREKRYQSAEEFQRALHKFLYSYMPEFNPSDLGYYAKDLFKEHIVEDRKRVQRLNEEVERLLVSSMEIELAPQRGGESEAPAERLEETTVVGAVRRSEDIVIAPEHGKKPLRLEVEALPPSATAPRRASAPSSRGSGVGASPPQQRGAKGRAGGLLQAAAIAFATLLGAIFFAPELGIPLPAEVAGLLGGSESALTLEGNESNVTVSVDGKVVGWSLPLSLSSLPSDRPFRLSVVGAHGSFEQELVVKKGERKSIEVRLTGRAIANDARPEPSANFPSVRQEQAVQSVQAANGEKTVLLRLEISPPGRPAILINGKRLDPDFPVLQVPLDTPLELTAERGGYKAIRREFVLEESKYAGQREVRMELAMELVEFGFLTLRSTPSADASLMLDGHPWVRRTPIQNEKLPVGSYTVKLTNEVLGMEKTLLVNIQDGKVVEMDVRLEIRN
ncbi:MAG: serine/threonine protein kinase [Oligoflexia bacterium]|nr:serine/threonine protein kinase [Oligoflexia bacterium]